VLDDKKVLILPSGITVPKVGSVGVAARRKTFQVLPRLKPTTRSLLTEPLGLRKYISRSLDWYPLESGAA